MTLQWTLDTDKKVENFNAVVANMRLRRELVQVKFLDKEKIRSLSTNDMIYAIYTQVTKQKEDVGMIDIRRKCKLDWGVPLLKGSNKKFRHYLELSMFDLLPYDQQLESMDILPVSSLMSPKVASEYIDTMIREYSQHGLCLTHPSENQ